MGAAARVAGEGGRQGGSDCGICEVGAASCEGDSDGGLGLQRL